MLININPQILKTIGANRSDGIMTSINIESEIGETETVFVVRENKKYINKISKYQPQIEIKSHIFNSECVSAFFIMVRFDLNYDTMYDSWFNFNADHDGNAICNNLTKQEEIQFVFINDQGKIMRTIKTQNTLKEKMDSYIEISKNKGYWEMYQYDNLKAHIYKKYPTGRDLWLSLLNNQVESKVTDLYERKTNKKGTVQAEFVEYFTLK